MRSARIRFWATTSLVFIFLVILAGSVVRATGSGMGCPDWPQCFGYNIPPTDVETLTWLEGRSFEEGQMILLNDQFWVATSDFTTGVDFAPENWALFDRHDYNIFNPVHTWIEFINRLIGALSGLPVLALAIFGVWGARRNVWNAVLAVGERGRRRRSFQARAARAARGGNWLASWGARRVTTTAISTTSISTTCEHDRKPAHVADGGVRRSQ